MIAVPEQVAQEQETKNQKKGMIVAIAMEIYPHIVGKVERKADYSWAARDALHAAQVFIDVADKFEV